MLLPAIRHVDRQRVASLGKALGVIMVINFSGALLRFVNFQKSVNLDASTVGEALSAVAARFPQSKAVIYDADGNVRKVHQIFVNGQQLPAADIGRSLSANDRMDVLTAIAGG
jgi:molybdopterin converting factor small subunit